MAPIQKVAIILKVEYPMPSQNWSCWIQVCESSIYGTEQNRREYYIVEVDMSLVQYVGQINGIQVTSAYGY